MKHLGKLMIVVVGMAMMACSDKPSGVINDDPVFQEQAGAEILEEYPGHLPVGLNDCRRLRSPHYIQMDVMATTLNYINIWLPEIITYTYKGLDKRRYFVITSSEVTRLKLDTTSTGGISLSGRAGEELEFTGTAEEFQYGLYFTIKYHNVSDTILENVASSICVQLTAAPDFNFPDLKNTFWYNKGKWDNTFITNPDKQEDIFGSQFYSSHLNNGTSMPLIIVDSQTSKHAIGLLFKGVNKIGGNAHRALRCIHSDGGPGIDALGPGETAVKEGVLIIHPEGKDAVLKIAQEFYSAS